ncbi:MAG: MoxR family ATPase [Eubacterium sp.]|nr:MoxR family ATPase [Eubacterium sp.]
MENLIDFLKNQGVSPDLLDRVAAYRKEYDAMELPDRISRRIPEPEVRYYGTKVWEKAIAALLSGENLLLAGPKATGKNVLAENLACLFGRPLWDVSFHVNVDAAYLIGTDTYDGNKVSFRPGPVHNCATYGGFGVLDEINMARNEALAVLHATLDFRHVIDVAGYDRIPVSPAARFIGTMNYGYAGTRDLNEALCSRFAILDMPLIEEADLQSLLTDVFPNLKDKILRQFVLLFYEIEKKAEAAEISERALDLRGLIDAIRLMDKGISSGDALEMTIVNKTFDAYERKLVMDVIKSRIPTDLKRADIFD